eukprot:3166019-Alexandrium_andersonii.AAC.1
MRTNVRRPPGCGNILRQESTQSLATLMLVQGSPRVLQTAVRRQAPLTLSSKRGPGARCRRAHTSVSATDTGARGSGSPECSNWTSPEVMRARERSSGRPRSPLTLRRVA